MYKTACDDLLQIYNADWLILSTVVAWEFVLLVSPFGLVDGGTPAVFWGLLLSPIVMLPVYASLAEVASMSPTAGGQFHWVSELAPPSFQKGLSYTTGWLLTLGWQTFLCGVSFSVVGRIELDSLCERLTGLQASLILGLATLGNPGYEIQAWHQTLLTMCIVVGCALFNVFLVERLPLTEAIVLVLHTLGVFGIVIPLWIVAPHGDVHDTIFRFTNSGGWQNNGLAAVIGMVPMIGMLIVGIMITSHPEFRSSDPCRATIAAYIYLKKQRMRLEPSHWL